MKHISVFIIVAAFSLVSCGQEMPAAGVPSVVQNTVPAKFPGATGIGWEKKKDYYEAEFKIDRIEHCLHIDEKGTVLLDKQEINKTELPALVIAALQKNYGSYNIDETEKIDKNGTFLYEIELEAKGKKDMKVFLTPLGEISNL